MDLLARHGFAGSRVDHGSGVRTVGMSGTKSCPCFAVVFIRSMRLGHSSETCPDLRQSLTSYVTLREQPAAAGLRSRVVRSIGAATAGRLKTYDELPTEATGTLRWWIAAAAGFAVLVAYTAISPKSSFQSAARLAAPLAAIDAPRRVSIRNVLPGDTDAIAGRAVAVSAVIDGLKTSETPVCRWRLPSEDREAAMRWDEADRRFHGEIDLPYSVSGNVPYTIIGGDAQAGPFYLKVEDLPAVALQSVQYTPPAYTAQKPHATSSGAITAPGWNRSHDYRDDKPADREGQNRIQSEVARRSNAGDRWRDRDVGR